MTMHTVKGADIHIMPAKTAAVKKNASNTKEDTMTTDKKRTEKRTRLVTDITSAGGYQVCPQG